MQAIEGSTMQCMMHACITARLGVVLPLRVLDGCAACGAWLRAVALLFDEALSCRLLDLPRRLTPPTRRRGTWHERRHAL